MNTDVAILHHDYPSELRSQVDDRLQGLKKFFDRMVSVSARLEKQGNGHRVELVAHVGHGGVLVSDVTEETLKGALGESFDRMRGQLTRHRDKVKLSHHRPGPSA